MKKHIRFNHLIATLFLFALVATTSVAVANDSSTYPKIQVEMKFIGNINEQPVFQLIVSGETCQNDYTITVRDEYYEVLYREQIKSDQFSKKFMLNAEELGDTDLLFEVFCKATKQKATYRLSRSSRSVQSFTISEQ